ncbi:MAG: DUF4241 domain-containing protein [Pseudomonadota bacterium]|jgi:hypothetical protein
MSIELIGHVGVDSGQLLLCDPCYIESEWEQEDFADIRVHQHVVTKDTLTYGKNFARYDQIIDKYGKNMNDLLATGEWIDVERPPSKHKFSYNACANATLSSKGHGQLNYKMGHAGVGVAFRTAFGDGVYPVYAKYADDGTLKSVEVVFWEDDEEENLND